MKTQDQQRSVKAQRRRSAKPTISDVAAAAGVSLMTVSRVINRHPNVLPTTREKVERAISRLGYVPNSAARSLAGGAPCKIAMLHNNPSAAYLSEFLVGSLEGARQNDSQLMVEHWRGDENTDAIARRFKGQHIDAVVLPPPLCEDSSLLAALLAADILVAQVATAAPSEGTYAVTIDDAAAAEEMTRHLLQLGHRRIGFIRGNPDQTASAARLEGYERALQGVGLAPEVDLIVAGDFSYRSGLSAAEALLSLPAPPTAIFASNDEMAAAAIAVAHRHRLAVPEEISICGFDDTNIATTVWPELTTVRQPIARMSREAVNLLSKAVRSGWRDDRAQGKRIELPHELVRRASTAARSSR